MFGPPPKRVENRQPVPGARKGPCSFPIRGGFETSSLKKGDFGFRRQTSLQRWCRRSVGSRCRARHCGAPNSTRSSDGWAEIRKRLSQVGQFLYASTTSIATQAGGNKGSGPGIGSSRRIVVFIKGITPIKTRTPPLEVSGLKSDDVQVRGTCRLIPGGVIRHI